MMVSVALRMPNAISIIFGAAGVISTLFAQLRLGGSTVISEWWQVVLPMTIAAVFALLCATAGVVLWFIGVVKLLAHGRNVAADRLNCGADGFIRLAKKTFSTHIWLLLVCCALWLLTVKLKNGASWPVIYPLVPVIMLGAIHVTLAVLFIEPEVDPVRTAGMGFSLLGHAAALEMKLDSVDDPVWPWQYVFMPSWLTYAWVLALCASRGSTACRRRADLIQNQMTGQKARVEQRVAFENVRQIVCVAAWALCFCIAQVMLTIRLNGAAALPWTIILAPALVGWITLVFGTAAPIDRWASCTINELLVLACGSTAMRAVQLTAPKDEEDSPLLARVLEH